MIESTESLIKKSVQGTIIIFTITALRFAFDFGSKIILARLLIPEHFGMIAFALVIIGFFNLFTSIQSNKFIIQKKGNIQEAINTAFTIKLSLNILFAVIVLIFAPLIMETLDKANLTLFVQVLAFVFLCNPFLLPRALFERELNFKKANIPTLISVIIGAVTAVLFAFLGFKAWSLIIGYLSRVFIEAGIIWKITPYRPRLEFNKEIAGQIIKYGGPLTLSSILAFFYWKIDDFMVGKIIGNVQLGYYWLAFYLPHYLLLIRGNLSLVVFPAFSKVRNDKQLTKGFILLTKYTAMFMLLPCVITTALGRPTLLYIFGEKWLPALVPFQIFMILVAIRATFGYWTEIWQSKEKTNIILFLTLLGAVLIPMIGYFFIKWQGITGMAMAVFISMVITHSIAAVKIKEVIDIKYIKILSKPTVAFLLTTIIGIFLSRTLRLNLTIYITLVIALSFLYSLLLYLFDRSVFAELRNIVRR